MSGALQNEKISCLTFYLEDELFAIPVSNVLNVFYNLKINKSPGLPKIFRGTFNYMGQSIPVIDLRLRYNKMADIFSSTISILVLESDTNGSKCQFGVLVDEVQEVRDFNFKGIFPCRYTVQCFNTTNRHSSTIQQNIDVRMMNIDLTFAEDINLIRGFALQAETAQKFF